MAKPCPPRTLPPAPDPALAPGSPRGGIPGAGLAAKVSCFYLKPQRYQPLRRQTVTRSPSGRGLYAGGSQGSSHRAHEPRRIPSRARWFQLGSPRREWRSSGLAQRRPARAIRMQGTIHRVIRSKGFGFILTGEQQYFFHHTEVRGLEFRHLTTGDVVEFQIPEEEIAEGKNPRAVEVHVLVKAPPPPPVVPELKQPAPTAEGPAAAPRGPGAAARRGPPGAGSRRPAGPARPHRPSAPRSPTAGPEGDRPRGRPVGQRPTRGPGGGYGQSSGYGQGTSGQGGGGARPAGRRAPGQGAPRGRPTGGRPFEPRSADPRIGELGQPPRNPRSDSDRPPRGGASPPRPGEGRRPAPDRGGYTSRPARTDEDEFQDTLPGQTAPGGEPTQGGSGPDEDSSFLSALKKSALSRRPSQPAPDSELEDEEERDSEKDDIPTI